MNGAVISSYTNTRKTNTYSYTQAQKTNTSTSTASSPMSVFVYLVPIFVVALIFLFFVGSGYLLDIHDDKVKAKKEALEHKAAEKRKRVYKNQQISNERTYRAWCNKTKKERLEEWKKRRKEFSYLKHSDTFKTWRKEQYKCQDQKCAWCRKYISEKSEFTHVDHVMPLFNGGTNDFSNMVLACKSCNKYDKNSEVKGFNNNYTDIKDHDDNFNTVPNWIKLNSYAYPNEFDSPN